MHIAINMPDLACFDFRSASKIWLQRKQRRFNHSAPKDGKQDWFMGVFECTTKVQETLMKIRTCHLRMFFDKIFAEK